MAQTKPIEYQVLELSGVRYAVLSERVLHGLCRRARCRSALIGGAPHPQVPDLEALDGNALAQRLLARREAVRLSQAELARRAGVRVETLNRIEKGRTTPDFATIRKLVIALKEAEDELRAR